MASTYRDRTSEFRSLSETLKKIGRIRAVNQSENDPASSKPSAPVSSRSEFNKKASRMGLGIHETSQKIARLAQLAKSSSMFDDPIVEIQQLTALIKDDITALNVALSDLQTIQNIEVADGNYSEDRVVHSTAVFDDLKSKLMGATKQLQDVLTTRTEHINKAHENRKQMFSKNALRENPFQENVKIVNEPPPWSGSSNGAASPEPPALTANGVQVGNQLRRRLAVDNTSSQQMEMSMLQQVVPQQENYTQSRAVALHNVESLFRSSVGSLHMWLLWSHSKGNWQSGFFFLLQYAKSAFSYLYFRNFCDLSMEQMETITTLHKFSGLDFPSPLILDLPDTDMSRIDDNMEESLANVEGARGALLRHLNQISSNRWLMIKIFAILIFFLVIFIFFVA